MTHRTDSAAETPKPHQPPTVQVWTDGACLRNPGGAGGWAAVLRSGTHRKEISGGVRSTSNNRMELRAVIEALNAIRVASKVELHTDSQVVLSALRRIASRGKELPANADLKRALRSAMARHKSVRGVWVQGHAGVDENERCDVLAAQAARLPKLPEDVIAPGPAEQISLLP